MERTPLPPRAVTATQAAQALSVSRGTIHNMVRDGRLRAIKLGTCFRIPVVELDALAEVDSDVQNAHDYRDALWRLRVALAGHIKEIDRVLSQPAWLSD